MYSASVIDNTMASYFLHFHEMTPMPIKNTYLMVDGWSFASPLQSTLQNPLKAISLPPRHILKSKMLLKYLTMRFTAIQCSGVAFDMNWLTVLIANAISTLVGTIAYMRDPTLALYKTPFIFLCTFSNFSSESSNNFEFASNGVPIGLHSFMLKRLRTSKM